MKIRYVSDIHLEFSRFPQFDDDAKKEINANDKEILLIAGDTIPTVVLEPQRTDGRAKTFKWRFDKFLESVAGFKQVYMIGGNHEIYSKGDVAKNKHLVNDYIATHHGYKNIEFLENDRRSLDDKTELLACTLWTDMNKQNPQTLMEMSGLMNDWYPGNCLRNGNQFTTTDAAEIHYESKKWLQIELMNNVDPIKSFVILTHHLPSFQSIAPQFKGEVMNFGYASEMDDFIYYNPAITHWIHGHTHFNVEYDIGQCKIHGHMRGYPPEFTFDRDSNWKNFKLDKYFEI